MSNEGHKEINRVCDSFNSTFTQWAGPESKNEGYQKKFLVDLIDVRRGALGASKDTIVIH